MSLKIGTHELKELTAEEVAKLNDGINLINDIRPKYWQCQNCGLIIFKGIFQNEINFYISQISIATALNPEQINCNDFIIQNIIT